MGLNIKKKEETPQTPDSIRGSTPLPPPKKTKTVPQGKKPSSLKKIKTLGEVKTLAKGWAHKKAERSHAFIDRLRNNVHKTDEELLKELSPFLNNAGTKDAPKQKDRPEVVDDKVLVAYRLKQRGLTFSQVAEQMGVTIVVASQWYYRALDYLKVDPATISIPQNVGQSLNFYEDVRSMALMMASQAKVSDTVKMSALRVALDAEKDKNDFLTRIGVYSAPVMNHFQQLMINQFAAPSTDAKNVGMDKFFSGLAQAFNQHSTDTQLQLIAQDGTPTRSDVFGTDGEVIDV